MKGESIKPIEVLGILEFENTAVGYYALDTVVKAAPVEVLKVVTVNPGKLVVFITGDVASVEASVRRGIEAAASGLVDSLVLPWIHETIVAALLPALGLALGSDGEVGDGESLGFYDASTITAGIAAADRAVKEAGVQVILIRLDDAMGGRVSVHFAGDLHDVEVAMAVVKEKLETANRLIRHAIVANPHPDMRNKVAGYEA